MHNTNPTSEVLNTAADLIEKRGWATGAGWSDEDLRASTPLCVQGAIAAASGASSGVGHRCPAYHAVASYLGLDGGLFVWNDNLRFTEDFRWVGGTSEAATEHGRITVIATLRAAALIEAAREEQDAAWSTYADAVTA